MRTQRILQVVAVCLCVLLTASCTKNENMTPTEIEHCCPINEGEHPYRDLVGMLSKKSCAQQLAYYRKKSRTLNADKKWADSKEALIPFVQDLVYYKQYEIVDRLEAETGEARTVIFWSEVCRGSKSDPQWKQVLHNWFNRRKPVSVDLLIASACLKDAWASLLTIVRDSKQSTYDRYLAAVGLVENADEVTIRSLETLRSDRSELELPAMRNDEKLYLGDEIGKRIDKLSKPK